MKKKCGNQTVGAPGLANGGRGAEFERHRRKDRGAEGVGCGRGVPFPTGEGAVPYSKKKIRFWISNRWILVQTGCFVYSSPKAGLSAIPTVKKLKIILGTPFPGIPAGNDPCL